MGIYDRDYYRREGPSYLDALIPSGAVCKWLIGVNVGIYLLQIATRPAQVGPFFDPTLGSGPITDWLILDPNVIQVGQLWRLLTYAFLHSPDTLTHVLFNMLFLWWFGSDLEALYGPREFLAFYLTAALLGGVAYASWSFATGDLTPCLGASGAVTALLVLCAFHFPNRMIYLFLFFPIPIWLFAIFNVAQDAFYFVGAYKTNVAVVVHLAGALFAGCYYKTQLRLLDVVGGWKGLWKKRRVASSRLKLYRPETEQEPARVAATRKEDADEQLEARLDAVLEKLARTGKESLTESERQILQRASEIYKRRRT